MIVSGLHSHAECPTSLQLLHSRNGHEPEFCRCPGVFFEHPEFPQLSQTMRASGSCARRCLLFVIRRSLSRSLRISPDLALPPGLQGLAFLPGSVEVIPAAGRACAC
jgi:hypothetical protein